jgi:hypothetical protein
MKSMYADYSQTAQLPEREDANKQRDAVRAKTSIYEANNLGVNMKSRGKHFINNQSSSRHNHHQYTFDTL